MASESAIHCPSIRDFSKSVLILSRIPGRFSDWATFQANWAIFGHFGPFLGHFGPFFRYFGQFFGHWHFRNWFSCYAFMNAPIFCRFFPKFGHGIKNMPRFFAELLQILGIKYKFCPDEVFVIKTKCIVQIKCIFYHLFKLVHSWDLHW